MIALNEILKNKEEFTSKYRLMGKKYNLDKIIKLEQKFIEIDSRKNKNRSACNKLCSQVAEKINKHESVDELINKINKLDKTISKDEKKSNHAMTKINKLLKKLPNLALENNLTDQSLISEANHSFGKTEFIKELNKIVNFESTKTRSKKKLLSLKNRVFKSHDLPIGFVNFNSKNKSKFVILLNQNADKQYDLIISMLIKNAQDATDKSIKTLDKYCSKEILATLCDNSKVSVKFSGEYISREIGLKLYDKEIDMTKFVNIIIITVKNHG